MPAAERTRLLETQMFGRHVHFRYGEHWVGWSLFWLRIALGWVLFWGGLDKLMEGLNGLRPEWSAAFYLNNIVPEGNPFREMFVNMATPTTDFLVAWGLFLTGLCLLLGLFTRFAAFWGAVMMLFFWLAAWTGWFKLEHGWVVDDHVIYMLLLFALGAFGAGRILGLDGRLERTRMVQKNKWLEWILG